jgi:hypothetical protein
MGDRIKLINRAQQHQIHKEESKGHGRGSAVATAKSGPKLASSLNHSETKGDDRFPKIPTLQQICKNLGMTPEKQPSFFQPTLARSTRKNPPKKPLPSTPDIRWSIAALSGVIPSFSGGYTYDTRADADISGADISGADRPSSSLVAEKDEASCVPPKELVSESAASWQVS